MSKNLFYKQREDEIASLLQQVENGDIRALQVYADLKRTKDLFDEALKQIQGIALEEASQYSERTFEESGYTFEKRNGATRYSYNHIPQIVSLKDEIKRIEAKSKQAYLSQQKGILTADENGEEIPLPKVTYSKDTLIVKHTK